MKKTVIFDLDGTLALIDKRRAISTKDDGKMDWDIFFDPKNIDLDEPNTPVIKTLQMFLDNGFKIVILSGRSDKTFNATSNWLMNNQVMWHQLKMRPQDKHFLPDDELKQNWVDNDPYIDKDDIFAVFDEVAAASAFPTSLPSDNCNCPLITKA